MATRMNTGTSLSLIHHCHVGFKVPNVSENFPFCPPMSLTPSLPFSFSPPLPLAQVLMNLNKSLPVPEGVCCYFRQKGFILPGSGGEVMEVRGGSSWLHCSCDREAKTDEQEVGLHSKPSRPAPQGPTSSSKALQPKGSTAFPDSTAIWSPSVQ